MDKTVCMKIQGIMVELLVELDPSKYKEFVYESPGKKALYVKLQKALYGTLWGIIFILEETIIKIAGVGLHN
jgi:hypothetical protein